MEELKVCRICLVMDVKMHDLCSHPLDVYYENVIGGNVLKMVQLRGYACYMCAPMLRKFHSFRERCLKGQTELYGLLNSFGKISRDGIIQLHKQNQSSSYLENIKLYNIVIDANEDDAGMKIEPTEIYQSRIYNVESGMKEIDNERFKQEVTHQERISFNIIEDIKQEEEFYDYNGISSDDDEPLSVHKEKKEDCKNRSRIDDKIELEVDAEANANTVLQELCGIITKKKRGRPKKGEVRKKIVKRSKHSQHIALLENDGLDVEDYCNIITLTEEEQREEVIQRQQSLNYINSVYKCNLCYKGFVDTHAWKHHVAKHEPSAGDLECNICKMRFKTIRILKKHAGNHGKRFSCKSCSYVSKNTTQAKQHQQWHKGVTYKCQHCEEIFSKWTSYLSHVRMKHPSEHICGACGYSFVSRLGLNMHRTMMHKDLLEQDNVGDEDKDSPYCEQCDVKFTTLEAYKRHMVTSVKHTQSTDFGNGCRECGETFPDSEALRVHHRHKHARQRPRNYGKRPADHSWPATCEHCTEVIRSAREYWSHFRRVHPDKTYPTQKDFVCDVCGKSFRSNAFLNYHKRTHSSERSYKCSQCPKAFHNRNNLQMHQRTHSDERPYPCALCDKAFKCKSALDRHFRSHSGEKPYVCQVCGKAFAQSNSRKLHVRTVHLKQSAPYVSRARLERRTRPNKEHAPASHLFY
ncbi:unnamed protein product [Danaus chrysippus]|uniref:(African queen) hypothetical protein n=1 Tax=Danaus chrysippus TaxID=151541 RepID=A0A8J2W3I2_9NEOP|nr:unnamed protein product [Danaus chrysippus]